MTPSAKAKASELDAGPTPANWREVFLFWAMRQGILAVLLLVMVGILAWVGRYAVIEGIPNVIDQIQRGYDRMEDKHRSERLEYRNSNRQTLDKLEDTIDKTNDSLSEQTEATRDLIRKLDN